MSPFPTLRSHTDRKQRRGSILLLSIFFLFVLFLLALAFVILLPTELNAALQEQSWIQGEYAADAGLEEVLGSFESQLAAGTEPAVGPALMSGTLGDWSWTVDVTADAATLTGGGLHAYSLVSTASVLGTPKRILRIKVLQDSFARYATYEDANSSHAVMMANSVTTGPVHYNTQVLIGIPAGYYSTATTPAFQGTVTQAVTGYMPVGRADGIIYTDGNLLQDDTGAPWYPNTPAQAADRYSKLFKDGRAGVITGVKPIDMPPDTGSLKKAAFGGTGFPTSIDNKVYVTANAGTLASGLYVNGDAQITLSVVNGNPVTTIQTASATYKVTECRGAGYGGASVGQTVVEGPTTQTYTGFPNGAVFTAGNITSLKGTYEGRLTIGADVANNKTVRITDNILQASAPPGTNSLGIVGTYVLIASTAPRTLDIYAAVYAGKKTGGTGMGSFMIEDSNMFYNDHGNPPPTLNLHGGQSEAVTGATAYSLGGGNFSGYSAGSVTYDPSLANNPPPFFPSYPKLRMCYYEEAAP